MDRLSRLLCLQFEDDRTGVSLDLSRMGFSRAELSSFAAPMAAAFEEMRALEAGMVVNRDEDRRVGHYWLRDPELAPGELAEEIRRGFEKIRDFAGRVLDAGIPPPRGGRYRQLCLIGIGGSALGPQFLAEALHEPGQGLSLVTLDNSDPDGIRRSLKRLELPETLFVVISKSGGTLETRNGMLEARAALQEADLDLARQAVAITMAGSKLDRLAESEGWLQRFPLKDWVGGRTSITSAAGLLPAALMGIDVKSFLNGARAMDENTRRAEHDGNLAALMASAWHLALHGASRRNLVVLPYRDRLALLGRYLQQLVMESLGKELDRRGRIVHQGLTVYGNKGSTDQHAYVQQLRDGADDFFVCFVRVLHDGDASGIQVEPGITSADYLQGFYIGTRQALSEKGRLNMTLCLPRLDAFTAGALVALFERTVGLYAALIDVNAYHQPGVEAGKQAASAALGLRRRILERLGPEPLELETLLAELGPETDPETCLLLLQHLAANPERTGVEESGGLWSRG